MKKLFNFIIGRPFSVAFLILLQLALIISMVVLLSQYYFYFYVVCLILAVVIVFNIINRDMNPSAKLPWVIVVLILPIFGGILYFLFGSVRVCYRIKKRHNRLIAETAKYYPDCDEIISELTTINSHIGREARFIKNASSMSIYKGTATKYLSPGEDFFEALVRELKAAKRFIFMEYFIVHEGIMWDTVLGILAAKAAEGVEVRMMYDDVGCVNTLPKKYYKKLEAMGIKCSVFNPFRPTLSVSIQNRDHRKITVIDGHTAFTGGINLADEYINKVERFGHWKDASIMLKGPAVWSLTVIFLQTWNFYKPSDTNYLQYYLSDKNMPPIENAKGYVQPYADSPFNNELISEYIYMNVINTANHYIYITTPYLIVDNELVTALILAAKSGVDVRIITPHIPDKWYVHLVTQAYYPILIKNGVRIFEYEPGFIHSKTVVSDDFQGIVGTVNFDYRSLYHHFECGVFMYETTALDEVKADFLATQRNSIEISYEDCKNVPWYKRIMRGILRIFSALM